ncbi:hypothetical protein Tco_0216020 [Tanacetum coccineum]
MQTQEDHSNPIPALNVDSLKVDLVVIQNTCSEKEDSNSETASSKLVKVNSSAPTYDPEPATVTEDEEMSKEKEIDKLMALISLSFKKIYKPTNNNLELHQTPVELINRGTGYENQRAVNVAGARENVEVIVKQEEAGVQLNAEQADWKDDY